MCGIAGVLFKNAELNATLGETLIEMLDGCQHRGPDSTGFALYGDGAEADEFVLRFHVGAGDEGAENVDRVTRALEAFDARIVDGRRVGGTYRATVRYGGDVRKLAYAMERAAKLFSIGGALDIVKDVGGARDVDEVYDVRSADGSHGLGHVRLATESDVKPEAAHPFWATGFSDVAIVHNGQITNYWKMRRLLEQRDYEFHTDNDSELIAVYLADRLEHGETLRQALETSIDDLDGTFSFLASTRDEMGYAKDRLAAKPMVLYENDDLIAIASEEVSLNRLFPGRALDTTEPPPGTCATWSR